MVSQERAPSPSVTMSCHPSPPWQRESNRPMLNLVMSKLLETLEVNGSRTVFQTQPSSSLQRITGVSIGQTLGPPVLLVESVIPIPMHPILVQKSVAAVIGGPRGELRK